MPAASTNCFGVGFDCIPPISQIVTTGASPQNHNLCVSPKFLPWQFVSMADEDKNGGPNHLKAWRERADLTQAELADRVGTNANMIGYLESGERGLSAKWLRRLAPPLGITPGFLLDLDPSNIHPDLLDLWGKASDSERKQIVDVAKALVKDGTNN